MCDIIPLEHVSLHTHPPYVISKATLVDIAKSIRELSSPLDVTESTFTVDGLITNPGFSLTATLMVICRVFSSIHKYHQPSLAGHLIPQQRKP